MVHSQNTNEILNNMEMKSAVVFGKTSCLVEVRNFHFHFYKSETQLAWPKTNQQGLTRHMG